MTEVLLVKYAVCGLKSDKNNGEENIKFDKCHYSTHYKGQIEEEFRDTFRLRFPSKETKQKPWDALLMVPDKDVESCGKEIANRKPMVQHMKKLHNLLNHVAKNAH